jgi:site-specific DNA-methyltransferase (adenine-specific)
MTPVIVGTATLYLADCIEAMRTMPDNSVDSVVTDPPYHLTNQSGGPSNAGETPQSRAQAGANSTGFMGKAWDGGNIAQRVELWAEVARVLKPGGHVLAFGGARTYHRMVCSIEDAGFEIRDRVLSLNSDGQLEEHYPVWIFGSGFPKAEIWTKAKADKGQAESVKMLEAGYEGWARGGLKPAHEPICVARKPLVASVAENVLLHGVGALNIDACRVHAEDPKGGAYTVKRLKPGATLNETRGNWRPEDAGAELYHGQMAAGRFPANVIHDGGAEVVAQFPAEAGQQAALKTRNSDKTRNAFGEFAGSPDADFAPHDARGSAARFFYCPKASRADRNGGLFIGAAPVVASGATMRDCETADWSARNGNSHPTVKPTDLMAYLCRLVTPPGGVVLDPFMGSGSTGKACMREGFRFVGCELEPEYLAIAAARIGYEHGLVAAANVPPEPTPQLDLFAEPQEAAV